MMKSLKLAVFAFALTTLFAPARLVADCGSIPILSSPLEPILDVIESSNNPQNPELTYDPLEISVFEPKQRAIILWNGEEETLLLSTDQRATQASKILEVIPLPARPEVKAGDFETFEKAQQLVVKKRTWMVAHPGAAAGGVEIPPHIGRVDFAKKIGAHEITVIKAASRDGFVESVQSYLAARYGIAEVPIRPEFVEIIGDYIDSGYNWFVFDIIDLTDKNSSRQPIEYRFASPEVFYPMRISTLEQGETDVELLVVSQNGVSTPLPGALPLDRLDPDWSVKVKPEDIEALSPGWSGMFETAETDSLTIDHWQARGDISTFTQDIRMR